MAIGSGIEWTEATWNPTTGCSKVSSGCANCYAETLAKRLHAMGQPKYRNGFTYTEHSQVIDLPLTWKKPRRVFVNSMSDLFHENATYDFTARCFEVMLQANWHTYQILTKRPHLMADFSKRFEERYGWAIPDHIWLGTSIENAGSLFRMDELRMVGCKTRFISFEPLLGPIGPMNLDGIHWVIIGGGERDSPPAGKKRMDSRHHSTVQTSESTGILQTVGRTTPKVWRAPYQR